MKVLGADAGKKPKENVIVLDSDEEDVPLVQIQQK